MIMSVKFWVEGVGIPLVSSFGLLGNLISILIFQNRSQGLDLNPNFSQLLICLAVFDSLFLVFVNSIFSVSALMLPEQSYIQMQATPYLIPLASMALTGSVYSVLAITVERYISLNHINQRLWNGKFYICIIVLFSVTFNLVKFFELTLEIIDDPIYHEELDISENVMEEEENVPEYELKATWLRTHPIYYLSYYLIGNFLFMNLLPMVVLLVLNYSIYRTFTRLSQIQESTTTCQTGNLTMAGLLFSIVIVFICCHSPKLALNVFEGAQMIYFGSLVYWPEWANNLTYINHLMLVINSSINILIYAAKDAKFRRTLISILRCKKKEETLTDISLNNIYISEITNEDEV